MRDIGEVIRQKKAEQNKLAYEIDMLNNVLRMLEEPAPSEEEVLSKTIGGSGTANAPNKWP